MLQCTSAVKPALCAIRVVPRGDVLLVERTRRHDGVPSSAVPVSFPPPEGELDQFRYCTLWKGLSP